ncbi:hypothetical protein RHMOL_Rhmol08G0050800 [Rhododendron molle]|uniref:Uncharacterized protein n=1 Tax=Rhododendron molle TaxID=49168 RepID=A0ACC0ML29_RHOML|nr:hypothetical protein RHMOL_Rhmol08G0050800 [Rhododendron molle]
MIWHSSKPSLTTSCGRTRIWHISPLWQIKHGCFMLLEWRRRDAALVHVRVATELLVHSWVLQMVGGHLINKKMSMWYPTYAPVE